ncbi:hypothetical protein M407DRAFT_152968 [Tulasnella calospora MUT 4182]|uniref:Uncharacterized protein n=1 Tax=Tulasnella calospora MUT 4182 TaxID=1051891 RepID=A0A0C3Q6Q0_9AGAM|nr:hypothetical protein M407DRAFT_152968 [Tulasnella calospora MUT 4182]
MPLLTRQNANEGDALPTGEPDPRKSPHPDDPFAGMWFMPMLALAGVCLLFILYRRAASIKYVVANQFPVRLKTWSGEGQIRLSEDEGPSAQSFVVNDEHEREDDDVVTPSPLRSPQPDHPSNLALDRAAV